MKKEILDGLLTKHINGSLSKEEQEQLSTLLQNAEYDALFVAWLDGIFERIQGPKMDNAIMERIWDRIIEKISAVETC